MNTSTLYSGNEGSILQLNHPNTSFQSPPTSPYLSISGVSTLIWEGDSGYNRTFAYLSSIQEESFDQEQSLEQKEEELHQEQSS